MIMIKGTPAERAELTRVNFGAFFTYYLPHYVNYEFAPFHYEMMGDVHDLINGDIKELAWIQFRESSKTSFAKGLLLYLICFRLDEYINVDSYDRENAERMLYDVVWELQTNERILADFGQLYNVARSKDQVTQKRISNFVTNPPVDGTGIRVEAHSTQEPVRGRLHGSKRPGFVVLDDFENKKTTKSDEYTKNIREHIQEFKGGLDSTRGRVLYLGNYLSEFANVQSIIERSKVDENLRIRIVPIADDNGKPTWPEKYGEEKGKVSVAEIKKRMWTPESGDDDFMAEMMCRPVDYSNAKFKKEWIEENRYMEPELKDKRMNRFIAIDNALAVRTESDFIGVNVIDVDENNIWYSVYVKRLKLNSPDLVDEIFRLFNTYKPKVMGVEQKAFEDLIEPWIRAEAKRSGITPFVVALKDKGIRKEDRIEGRLLGRFKLGMIKLKKYATDDTQWLVKELAQFPNGKHDDLIDSLQYIHEIAFAPQPLAEKKPTTMREIVKADIASAYEDFKGNQQGNSDEVI